MHFGLASPAEDALSFQVEKDWEIPLKGFREGEMGMISMVSPGYRPARGHSASGIAAGLFAVALFLMPAAVLQSARAEDDTGSTPGNESAAAPAESSAPAATKTKAKSEDKETGTNLVDPYPLPHCAGCDADLSIIVRPSSLESDGRQLLFCCPHCKADFQEAAEKQIKTLDEEIVAQQRPFYPAKDCIVSGEALAEKGNSIDFAYRNRLIRVCSPECRETFEKDPAKYLLILDKAVAENQSANYPITTCVVSGDELKSMASPVQLVVGNRLVRLSGEESRETFLKNPPRYLAKLELARAESNDTEPKAGAPPSEQESRNNSSESAPVRTAEKP